MDSTNDVCLERFINVMADLITKYADKIDLDSLPDVEMPEAETSKVSASFSFMGKILAEYFWNVKYRNISRFFSKKGIQAIE